MSYCGKDVFGISAVEFQMDRELCRVAGDEFREYDGGFPDPVFRRAAHVGENAFEHGD